MVHEMRVLSGSKNQGVRTVLVIKRAVYSEERAGTGAVLYIGPYGKVAIVCTISNLCDKKKSGLTAISATSIESKRVRAYVGKEETKE